MPNFADCWAKLKALDLRHADADRTPVLGDADRASIEARIQEHLKTMPSWMDAGEAELEAARRSVQSHLDEAHAQLQSIYDQVAPKSEQQEVPTTGSAVSTSNYFDSLNKSLSDKYGWSVKPADAPNRMWIVNERGKPIANLSARVENDKLNLGNLEALPDATGRTAKGLGLADKLFSHASEFSKETGLRVVPSALTSPITRAKFEKYFPAGSNDVIAQPASPISEAGQAPAVAGQPKIEGGTGEEVQKGQEGRQAVLATERVQPPAVPPETPEALGEALKERPRNAGVANRVLQERAARGEIPQAPEAGEGHLTEDIINKSRQDYTPERALAAAENIKNGSTNEADAGQIRIHEENLTRVARDAEKALDADPKNPLLQQAYNAAKDNLSKWHNETVQPMKTQWSNIGKSMQGATDIDTGSYIGLQKLAWDTAKRDFTPQEEPVMRTAAKRVSKATDEVRAAIAKAEDHVQKVLKPSRYMDLNQLRESLAEKLKNITC